MTWRILSLRNVGSEALYHPQIPALPYRIAQNPQLQQECRSLMYSFKAYRHTQTHREMK